MVGVADALCTCLGQEVAAVEAGCSEWERGSGDAEAGERL
jgi:hypothetical protein